MAGPIREAETVEWISRNGFCTARVGTIGVELEWIAVDLSSPDIRPAVSRLRAAAAEPLPGGGQVTFEPGGQVELSSAPAPDLATCITNTAARTAPRSGPARRG